MARRYPRGTAQGEVHINITPFVDVLIILVVILMLAMPMFVKQLPVDLPTTALAGTPTPMKSLAVSLNKEGAVYIDNLPRDAATLAKLITPTTTVELFIDKEVTYELMAKLVAEVQKSNPKEIILVTR